MCLSFVPPGLVILGMYTSKLSVCMQVQALDYGAMVCTPLRPMYRAARLVRRYEYRIYGF